MQLPKGRMPNDVLQYCTDIVGGSITSYLCDDIKLKQVTLGHCSFSAETNRELLEQIFSFVANLPKLGDVSTCD